MDIFVLGGTGFVGKTLVPSLLRRGHRLTLLSRGAGRPNSYGEGVRIFEGDPMRPGPWQDELRNHDAVINLAGASIFRRWTRKSKKLILESRTQTTGNVAAALETEAKNTELLINASAVGYYGFHGDEQLDETAPPGSDFLASVVAAWEAEALRCEKHGVRVILSRFGLVMGRSGGSLEQMKRPFKFFAGSPLGNGRQWMSWIHEQDLTEMILFLLDRSDIKGPVNCTSPHPVRNRELTGTLARILKRPVILPPVPVFLLRIVLGELSSIVVKGQRVIPSVLEENGFQPKFPTIDSALRDLLT